MRLSRYSLNSERSSKNLSHCNSRNTGSTEPTLWSVERTPSGSEPERESSSGRMAYTPNTRASGTKRRSDFRRIINQIIKLGAHFEFAMCLHPKTNRVGKSDGSKGFRAGIAPPLFQIRSKGHTLGMSKSITQQSIPLPCPAIPRGHPHLSRGSL